MTTRAADDFTAIRARARELDEARRREIFECTCTPGIDERGRQVKVLAFDCPVHTACGALAASGFHVKAGDR